MKWFQELEQRYLSLRPQLTKPEDFERLTDFQKSYYLDLPRLIDEVKAIHARHEDFKYVLSKLPHHPLIEKIQSGKLKPEDKLEAVS